MTEIFGKLFSCCGPRPDNINKNSDSDDNSDYNANNGNNRKVRSKKKVPLIKIAFNQIICQYFNTDPGTSDDREYSREMETMRKILLNQK